MLHRTKQNRNFSKTLFDGTWCRRARPPERASREAFLVFETCSPVFLQQAGTA
jgi:hypothetical protein